MSDEYLIRHCAPTLAGIKTGNLFTCPIGPREELVKVLRHTNRRLGPKGLRVLPLRIHEGKALIYLYRLSSLSADLTDSAAEQILLKCGYEAGSCERCIVQLVQRLKQQPEFPHEIGLFLGYPPEDVCGFMENRACNCKYTGCWKVYGDEAAAKKKFDQYKTCTRIYREQWETGKDIERLAVAG